MYLWGIRFQTSSPLPALPRALDLCSETQRRPSYRHFGRFRQAERQCIYKYTLEGEGRFADGSGEHRVGPGQGFLCEIRDPSTGYYYPAEGRKPWTFVFLTFRGGAARAMVQDLVARYGAIYDLPADEGIVPELLRHGARGSGQRSVAPAESARLVMSLLLALAASKENRGAGDLRHLLVRRARETVARRLRENLNVTDLASELGVSREHLTRVFKMETGETPHAYIVRQKMLSACHLLKGTTKSTKQISAELGYGLPAHFTRTFKRVLRMTPTRFRAVGTIPGRL